MVAASVTGLQGFLAWAKQNPPLPVSGNCFDGFDILDDCGAGQRGGPDTASVRLVVTDHRLAMQVTKIQHNCSRLNEVVVRNPLVCVDETPLGPGQLRSKCLHGNNLAGMVVFSFLQKADIQSCQLGHVTVRRTMFCVCILVWLWKMCSLMFQK